VNIELAGLSKRGRQVIKERGARWRVLTKRDSVLFSDKRGPWLLVVPADLPQESETSRWIHSLFDENFKVMP